MKLRNAALAFCGLALTAGLVSCGGSSSSSTATSTSTSLTSSSTEKKETIKVIMIASNDADTIETKAKSLTPYLNSYVKDSGYEFSITVSASYEAAAEALISKQADASFIPAGTYAQYTTTNPGTMEVLAAASRSGYKVQCDDYPGLDAAAQLKQAQAMNGEIDNYVYRGEQSSTQVSFYSAELFCRRDAYSKANNYKTFDTNGDGKITLQELHDGKAIFGIMGNTSSAGYIYPSYYVYQQGFTKGFVSQTDYDAMSAADQAKALIGVNQSSYPAGVASLMTGTIDVSCGFMDTRYASAYVQADGAYYQKDTVFTDTYTVAVTDPMMNDTITVRTGMADAAKTALFDAFVAATKDGSKDDDATPAGLVYKIYSHTGYVTAKDSDYDSARAMYAWKKAVGI